MPARSRRRYLSHFQLNNSTWTTSTHGAAIRMLLQVLRDLELVLDLTLAPLKRCASIEDHVGSVLDDHIHASILTSLLMTAVRLPPLKAYVRQLHDLAFSSDRRPVVLLGAGGEGKSVLMAMLCEELVQQRPLVRLSRLSIGLSDWMLS